MERFLPSRSLKDLSLIIIATLSIITLIWLPHILGLESLFGLNFSQGFNTIYRNYDGINYIVIAKTLYNPEAISALPISLPAGYFAAHFPGYPILILLFAPILGFLKSMLFVSILFTILSAIAFYLLIREFKISDHPLLISLIFLVLPARWVVVHSVGSAEPVFIFFVLMAIYFFMKFEQSQKMAFVWLASLFGAMAQFTRPPGVLLFIALGIYILWKIFHNKELKLWQNLLQALKNYYPLLLMPLTLAGIFYWYQIAYNDFFAYFHSGDNIHLTFPPFQVFNKDQAWVGEFWLEDVVYTLLLGLLGGLLLFKQRYLPMAFFVLTYFTATSLVAHRDIARYILPIFPFVLISFEKVLVSREFKIALAILLPAIYLYAQNFILNNTAPIPNLELFN